MGNGKTDRFVDEETCKATHKYDEEDRAKLDQILVQVTQTAQWARNHDGAHRWKGASIINMISWVISLAAVTIAIFALK